MTIKNCQNCGLLIHVPTSIRAKNFRKNVAGIKEGEIIVCEHCSSCFQRRQEAANRILTSEHEKRLIVAGPGTGKSFTFGEVLKQLPDGSTAIVFTLINNLVNELEKDLSSIENRDIKVNTLHGFCKQLLYSRVRHEGLKDKFEYFPLLPELIEIDAQLLDLGFTKKEFSSAFAQMDEGDRLQFYLRRGSYYNAVSHTDSVYRVFEFYRRHMDEVPSFTTVIVDEYQDFNRLESSLIDILATKSKILIAGDDDQALYGFRDASKEYIRNLHASADYEKHCLPFCSRCTPVMVDSINYFVRRTQSVGLLAGRIPREFQSYWPDKYLEHNAYPKIEVANCTKFDPTALKLIKKKITTITEKEKINGDMSDLPFVIIGPESGYHLDQVKKYLQDNLDLNRFEVIDSRREDNHMEIIEGYRLIKKGASNLGWRIVLHIDPLPNIQEIIRKTYETNEELEKYLPKEYIAKHKPDLDAFQETGPEIQGDEQPTKVRILLTNYYGSKGLSALHTIVIGLNNYDFPSDPQDVQDAEVCKFIVALTRGKNSCTLVTDKNWDRRTGRLKEPSLFLAWLPQDRLTKSDYKAADFE